MSTKLRSPRTPLPNTEVPSLQGLEPLSPPHFPSFQELVELDANASLTTATPSKKMNDLFDGMLGTLEPLLADYQATPEKYGVETHDLLEQLIHGIKSLEQLSTIDRHYLNLATLDFFGTTKVEPPRRPIHQPAEEESTKEAEDEQEEDEKTASEDTKKPEAPIPGVDVPVTELPVYWWLQ